MPPKKNKGGKGKDDDWNDDAAEKKLAMLTVKDESDKEAFDESEEEAAPKPKNKKKDKSKKAMAMALMMQSESEHDSDAKQQSDDDQESPAREESPVRKEEPKKEKKEKKGKKEKKKEKKEEDDLDELLANLDKKEEKVGKKGKKKEKAAAATAVGDEEGGEEAAAATPAAEASPEPTAAAAAAADQPEAAAEGEKADDDGKKKKKESESSSEESSSDEDSSEEESSEEKKQMDMIKEMLEAEEQNGPTKRWVKKRFPISPPRQPLPPHLKDMGVELAMTAKSPPLSSILASLGPEGERRISVHTALRGTTIVTMVRGMSGFDIDLKVASKFFASKFACRSSVTGAAEITIQGDVKDDLFELTLCRWVAGTGEGVDDLGVQKR